MATNLTTQQIKEKQRKIAAIYYEYLAKLHLLSIEQQTVIEKYIKELESNKLTNLRNKIKA